MCINPHLRRYIMKSFYILAVLLAFSSVSSLAQPSFAQDDEVQESTEADTASPDEESDEEDSEEAVESTEANLKEKVFPVEFINIKHITLKTK